MSNRQNHCNPNSVWLRLSLAEGCARPSLPLLKYVIIYDKEFQEQQR